MSKARRQFVLDSLVATAALTVGCRLGSEPAAAQAPAFIPTSDRTVAATLQGMATSDGAGVKLTRVIGQPMLRHLDPFLMLDRFHSDDPNAYIAGFPSHPHRGFETVTIMLDGRMRHRDSQGNSGLIQGGGSQWMTAGRGIIHSEMPEQEQGLMSGFQLWINLPAKEKMCRSTTRTSGPSGWAPAQSFSASTRSRCRSLPSRKFISLTSAKPHRA